MLRRDGREDVVIVADPSFILPKGIESSGADGGSYEDAGYQSGMMAVENPAFDQA